MTDRTDIAMVDPELELTFGPRTLHCSGTLSVRTRHHVLEAMDWMLRDTPQRVELDISGLHIADTDGANTLAVLQRMVNDAGAELRWRGLDTRRLSDRVEL